MVSNDGVACFGGDNEGQSSGVPSDLPPMARVFSTTYAACALPVGYDALPTCWGMSSNYAGVDALTFNPVDATQHGYHQCFLAPDGSLHCVASGEEGISFASDWRARSADWAPPLV